MTRPPDPQDDDRPRTGLGVVFWASILFCFACVLAGAAVAWLGPTWFPPRPAPAASSPSPPGLASPPRPAKSPASRPAESSNPDAKADRGPP